MKSPSTCSILFCILILIRSSLPLQQTIYTENPPSLSMVETQNLRTMLNFIRHCPDFRPLTLSIILPEFPSSFADFLLDYVGLNTIEAYKIRFRDLSLKVARMNSEQLTWTIVVEDVYSLYIFIYWQPRLWRTGNQYLIIFTRKGVTVQWRDILNKLWRKYSVYRALVVSVQDDFRCLIGYMPFEKYNDDFGNVRRVCLDRHDSFDEDSQGSYNGSLEIYTDDNSRRSMIDKVSMKYTRLFESFHRMNNYPLKVFVFESLLMNVSYDQEGLKLGNLDGRMVYALEETLGAKFRVTAIKKRDFKHEDPFDRSLRDIETGKVEIVITGFFVKTYIKHTEFHFTSSLYEDKLCFLSPDSGLVPKAYMPFLPFEKALWFLLIVYNILITLLWYIFKRVNESFQRTGSEDLATNVIPKGSIEGPLNGLQTRSIDLVNLSSDTRRPSSSRQLRRRSNNFTDNSAMSKHRADPPEVPRYLLRFFCFFEMFCYPFQARGTPAQKALLVGALFFGLIVNGVYQSCLVSSLSKPFHYPQLQTLEDVIDSGKMLITKYANLKSAFLDDTPLGMKLDQMIHVISSLRKTKDMVAFDKKIAITRYYTMLLGDYAYYDKDGNPLLYVVDECPMNYRISYVLRSHSPYTERVNFILLRLREAGLPGFWMENRIYPLKIVKMRRKVRTEERTIKLTVDHYSLTFLLLFGGLLVSTLMFFVEVYAAGKAKRG